MAAIIPDLTLCVASQGEAATLTALLTAITAAEDPVHVETIVIGPDPEQNGLAALPRRFPRTVWYVSGPEPASRALNRGLRLGKGRYLALWSETVLPRPQTFSLLLRFLDDQPLVGLAGPGLVDQQGGLLATARPMPALFQELSRRFGLPSARPQPIIPQRRPCWLSGSALLIRRETLTEVGLLDEEYRHFYADADYCLRAHRLGWHQHWFPEATALETTPGHQGAPPHWGDLTRFLLKKWLLRPAVGVSA